MQDAGPKIDEYRRHRLEREAQVLAAVRQKPGTAPELTQRVYSAEVGNDARLQAAAEMTLRAHLRKLVEEGRVREAGNRFELAGAQ